MTELIVVDCETTGLDVSRHVVIEVAAVNVRTGEFLTFVPMFDKRDLREASPEALAVNRYFERRVFRDMLSDAETRAAYERLWEMLRGNTFAGANARFDALMLSHAYGRLSGRWSGGLAVYEPVEEPWRYRLLDVGSYAAGVLGENPSEVWSLNRVCEAVGVTRGEQHTAVADAQDAAQCLRRLYALAATNRALAEGPGVQCGTEAL